MIVIIFVWNFITPWTHKVFNGSSLMKNKEKKKQETKNTDGY